jgi:copper chaperone CopZ
MKKIFNVKGMHCKSCSKMIEMELEDNVNKIVADHISGKVAVDFDAGKVSEKQIEDSITKLGYKIK